MKKLFIIPVIIILAMIFSPKVSAPAHINLVQSKKSYSVKSPETNTAEQSTTNTGGTTADPANATVPIQASIDTPAETPSAQSSQPSQPVYVPQGATSQPQDQPNASSVPSTNNLVVNCNPTPTGCMPLTATNY